MNIRFSEAPTNFYLGAQVDPDSGNVLPASPVYYESRDLTTHAVILGMTGSGKTGLGVTLLEEAAIDGIPQLIIDAKGDISNLLLAFPEVSGEHFEPWISPDEIPHDKSPAEYADSVAQTWREGLAKWGISDDRVQMYRRSSRFTIYTPGSDDGLPVSILSSFARPPEGWQGNEQMLRERISRLVSAILELIGISAAPLEDPEHILISNIFEYHWRNDSDLSLEQIILNVQQPPFSKLGVLDLDTVIDKDQRMKLAKRLNNIIAAPNFQSWIEGEPINIPTLLFTPEGQPRTTIFYIAQLNDAEQQFIVTLLLDSLYGWMQTLAGVSRLRAVLYIDEVFGLMPPHPSNPPTKEPLMRLLKEGRAFGVGVVIASQNAKDVDYKGLSNAGTWFIGKLQTQHDRRRVLEGLDSATQGKIQLSVDEIRDLLNELKTREFILHDIHRDDTPLLFRTRWAMSYLHGPLTRQQIQRLMANQRETFRPTTSPQYPRRMMTSYLSSEQRGQGRPALAIQPYEPRAVQRGGASMQAVQPSEESPVTAPTYSGERITLPPQRNGEPITKEKAPPGFSPIQPTLSTTIEQYYLPTDYAPEQSLRNLQTRTRDYSASIGNQPALLYRPSLLAQATVRFSHSQTNTSELLWYAFIVPQLPRMAFIEWEEYQSEPFDPHTLEMEPFGHAYYGDFPPALAGSGLTELRKSLPEWLYNNTQMRVYFNPELKAYSGLAETRGRYLTRLQEEARAGLDAELEKIAEQYDRKFDSLEKQIQQKRSRLDSEKEELESRKMEEIITDAESAWRLMRGSVYRTISRAAQMRRQTSQSSERIDVHEEDLVGLLKQLDDTEAEMVAEMQDARNRWVNAVKVIEEVPITPNKKDISVVLFGVGWVPYWGLTVGGQQMLLPASSSGLSEAQMLAYGDSTVGQTNML